VSFDICSEDKVPRVKQHRDSSSSSSLGGRVARRPRRPKNAALEVRQHQLRIVGDGELRLGMVIGSSRLATHTTVRSGIPMYNKLELVGKRQPRAKTLLMETSMSPGESGFSFVSWSSDRQRTQQKNMKSTD
jgi:hypothetical protein